MSKKRIFNDYQTIDVYDDELDAIQTLKDYLWEDEIKNFDENGQPRHHIFLKLQTIDNFLRRYDYATRRNETEIPQFGSLLGKSKC